MPQVAGLRKPRCICPPVSIFVPVTQMSTQMGHPKLQLRLGLLTSRLSNSQTAKMEEPNGNPTK